MSVAAPSSRVRRALSALLGISFLTAAYVFAWPSANVPYFAAIVVHLLGGLALLLLLLAALVPILRESTWETRIGWSLIALGGLLGAVLMYTGTRRAEWPLLYTHIGACAVGGAFLASACAARRGWLAGGAASAFLRVTAMLVIGAAIVAGAWWTRTVPWQKSHRIQNPVIAPATMDAEGDGPTGLYFPSSAQTADHGHIPANYFTESQSCQRCHADIYKEWQSSAHHFSSFNNPWYRKSIEYMQDTVGVKPSKWCAGCHDPALLYSGMFDKPIREVEDTPAGQAGLGCMMCHSISQVKSTMGQADFLLEYPELHKLAASNNPAVRWLHDYLTELNPEPHRRVFLKPFMKTQTADFCSSCHKVHLDVPVNHYRWVRGFDDYDNWQASGVSGFGARSFYYPKNSQMCADCHMPSTKSTDAGNVAGMIHSHQFVAANTAVPYANGDETQLKATEDFLKAGQVSVDVFAIMPEKKAAESGTAAGVTGGGGASAGVGRASGVTSRNLQTTFAVGEEAESSVPVNESPEDATPIALVTAPLNRTTAQVKRGETYRVDVVVRTRKLGHFFPGGTVDAFDCWVELKAVDDKGQTILWSGSVEDDGKGPVDPGAHFYKSMQIDAHGNPINKRNAWSTRATVYVHLIPPGAADTIHYRMQIPPGAGDHIHLDAKMNYRKFTWYTTQFSFAGRHDPNEKVPEGAIAPNYDDSHYVFTGDTKHLPGGANGVPSPPIVTMASNTADLTVLAANAPEPTPQLVLKDEDWTRWNDYGIGLFLQGDLIGAAGAFEKITQIDPKNPDGWTNVGRVRVQEGNIPAALDVLGKALAIDPHLARTNYFYARALRQEGHYDEAVPHLLDVLSQYPKDRVVHDDLGRIYFLQRRYNDALAQFNQTLAIDPEDLEANYNLMLTYTGLGQPDKAADFQKRYLRFKADESAQTLNGPYLRVHPFDNNERQPIHEHIDARDVERIAAADAKTKAAVAAKNVARGNALSPATHAVAHAGAGEVKPGTP